MEKTCSKKVKKLIKNTLLYTLSNFGSKVLIFFIVPLYTYYLSTTEYGEYDTLYSLIDLITPLCILSIHEGLLRWLLNSKEKDEEVFNTGIYMYIFLILITNFVLFIIYEVTSWQYSFVMMFCLTTSTLNTVFQFSTRGAKKNLPFAVSGIIQTIAMVSLNIVSVIFLKMGVNGMLISYGISQLLSAAYLICVMKRYFVFNNSIFNKKLAKEMFLYSIMLVPNNISWWVMNSSDRIMLSLIAGTSFTGIYSIATKFPSLLTMVHTIFYRAWQEQAVIEYDSPSRDSYYSKVFAIYMKLVFCLVLILIPASKIFILLFMNTDFKIAYMYIGILMLASIFFSFSSFYGTGYVSAKDTKNATFTTAIGAFVNCIINLLFIKYIGIWAACLSTLFGYFITWLIRVFQTKKYFTIKVDWKMFLSLMILNVLFTLLNMAKDIYSSVILLILSLIITLVINKKELLIGMNFIKRKFKSKTR